ncbi:hypothetical protein Acsp03_27940 [Actinomadura sp. NBRC 104412]|nr:hypothetical protein Acsp03_27940 [Actinomadura sp. NBRC 104412]
MNAMSASTPTRYTAAGRRAARRPFPGGVAAAGSGRKVGPSATPAGSVSSPTDSTVAVKPSPAAAVATPSRPPAIAPTHHPACIPFRTGRRYACSTTLPCAFIAMSVIPKAMPNSATATSSDQ